MIFQDFTEAERQQFIKYMLDNKLLEKAISDVFNHNNLIGLVEQLVQNDKDSKGLILGIIPDSKEMAGTYQLFDFNHHNLTFISNKGKKYLMLFTSEKAFNKHPSLQGLLYFVRDILQVALDKEKIDGVAFNVDSEYEILIEKFTIRAVLSLLDKKEGK